MEDNTHEGTRISNG